MENMQPPKNIEDEMICARDARKAAKNNRTIVRRNYRVQQEEQSEMWLWEDLKLAPDGMGLEATNTKLVFKAEKLQTSENAGTNEPSIKKG